MRIFINARRALGDCIYFLLVLKKIRDKFPDARINLVSWNSVFELFKESGLANACLSNSQYLELSPAEIRELTGDNDIYIDLQTTPESAIGAKRSRAEEKIAVFLPDTPIPHEEIYTHRLRWKKGEHVRTYLLRSFHQALGTDDEPEPIPIPHPHRLRQKVHLILKGLGFGHGEFLVGIHPGAKDPERRWLPERWATLSDWLSAFHNAKVLLLGSELINWGGKKIADMADNAMISRLARRKPFNLTGATPGPLLLAEVIRQLGLYVGLDTGPTHLAAAVGTPTLGLYRYRSAEHFNAWKIQGPDTRVIARDDLKVLEVQEVTYEIRLLLGLGG